VLLLAPLAVTDSALSLSDSVGNPIPQALATSFKPRAGLVFLVAGAGFPAWTDQDLAAFEGALLGASQGLHLGLASACTGGRQLLSLDALSPASRVSSGLAARLGATCPSPDLPGALEAGAQALAGLQTREPLIRLLVLAGSPSDLPPDLELPPGVELLPLDSSGPDLQGGAALAARIIAGAAASQERFAALGLCGGVPEGSVLASSDGWSCVFGRAHPGALAGPCDEAALAGFPRKPPAVVELVFTEEQRLLFEQLDQDKSKAEFDLALAFDGGTPLAARARFHGQTSMECERKSLSVNLKGTRIALPGGGLDDEFFLLSMCGDDRYFRQHSAAILARDLGIFQLPMGLVELRLEGRTRGPYLLVGKTHEILKQGVSGLASVIRRRFDPEDEAPEVKFSSSTPAQALADYRALVATGEGLAGESLVAALEQVLDLPAYLRMLAFFSVLRVGDWVDETIFYSEVFGANSEMPFHRFRPHVWDLDDCNEACHHEGKHAWVDPFGLAFCAEGDLEKRLLADPVIYGLFVEELAGLLEGGLAPQRIGEAVGATGALLRPYFARPEVCAVMNELLKKNPGATEPAVAQADLEATMAAFVEALEARGDLLKARIAQWRTAQEGR
jgi:hypothetical protein